MGRFVYVVKLVLKYWGKGVYVSYLSRRRQRGHDERLVGETVLCDQPNELRYAWFFLIHYRIFLPL